MGLLNRGAAWLADKIQAAGGVPVTYTRGGESLALTAVVGRTVFATNELDKARVSFGDRDYLIKVADLTLGEPQRGDVISEVIDGAVVEFEVLDPGTLGEPASRYSDPERTTWRVHVKAR